MRGTAAIAIILAIMGAALISGALGDSQTYDEAGHLTAGYRYWMTGDFSFNPDHPPLARMLAAAPLLFLRPTLPAEAPEWNGDQRMFAAVFLFRNRISPNTLLMAGRLVIMAQALALGLLLAFWMRREFGLAASLVGLALYALDPNVLAHGRYITTDLPSTLASFGAVVLWGAWLQRPRTSLLCASGVALGLALATKFSCVFLIPVFAALWLIRRWQEHFPPVSALAAVPLLAAATVGLAYGPETARVLLHPGRTEPLAGRIEGRTLPSRALRAVAATLRLPSHNYLLGLDSVSRHDRNGHPAYLLGQISATGGWPQYFPVAFAVKSPVALLAAIVAAIAFALHRRPSMAALRKARFAWFVLVVPLAVYVPLALNSNLNIGIRHLLPAYPFLMALVGAMVARRRVLAAAVVGIAGAEAAWIHPHQLAFFNFLAGGPAQGDRYLLDSNLDWAQDVRRLRTWLDRHGNPPVCFAYFGTADTEWYGVRHNGIPKASDAAARSQLDCVGAISVTLLHDLYLEPGAYAWLRQRRPIGHAGWSIRLYDLRRPAGELHNSYKTFD
jgi:hypothetical protein